MLNSRTNNVISCLLSMNIYILTCVVGVYDCWKTRKTLERKKAFGNFEFEMNSIGLASSHLINHFNF